MALIKMADVVEEVQRFLNENLGSKAQFFNTTWCGRNLFFAADRVLPALPGDILDSDVLINERYTLYTKTAIYDQPPGQAEGTTSSGVVPIGVEEGIRPFPTNMNDWRGISLLTARGQVHYYTDYSQFSSAVSQSEEAIPGIEEYHFIKQGNNLHYWPFPSVSNKTVRISYVRNVIPQSESGIYFRVPSRAVRPIVAYAASHGKWPEMHPDQAQALKGDAEREIVLAIGAERLKALASDTFIGERIRALLSSQTSG